MSALKWLPDALQDLERLQAFLSDKSPEAARRAASAILEAADQLAEHPRMGRPMDDDRREWIAPFGVGAYVLRYRIDAEGSPVVIRVWHSRERRDP